MKYHLWINDEAKSEIGRLPGHIRQRIRQAIQDLATAPRPDNSLQMMPPEKFELELRRIRLEKWRVIYIIDEEWSEIGILAVRKRPPYDYKDLPDLLEGLAE
ncbi:MAG: type II toxin-antitoxin system RelE/ParE family toxin [Anaerolineae bacterium]|nr:type II toxin-antitoxin system RelE/ParE family toxin [Anaerolineales bacterium]MCQ3972719.1 type II toxin-antitoxin system RelE/ParE family toxin [Anaerolineae bacterium]